MTLLQIERAAIMNELPGFNPSEDVAVFSDGNGNYHLYGVTNNFIDGRNIPADWKRVTTVRPLSDADIVDIIHEEWEPTEIKKRFATPESKAAAIMKCREALADRVNYYIRTTD